MVKKSEKTEVELLQEINEKLDDLVASFLIQGKEKEDQIRILVNRKFSNSKIANFLGIPKGTVDGIRAKKKKTK